MTPTITGASGTPLPSDVPHRTNPAAAVAETAHSPLPWHLVGSKSMGYTVHSTLPNGSQTDSLASLTTILDQECNEANASFICRAVNSHAALVAALRAAVRGLEHWEHLAEHERPSDELMTARKTLAAIGS